MRVMEIGLILPFRLPVYEAVMLGAAPAVVELAVLANNHVLFTAAQHSAPVVVVAAPADKGSHCDLHRRRRGWVVVAAIIIGVPAPAGLVAEARGGVLDRAGYIDPAVLGPLAVLDLVDGCQSSWWESVVINFISYILLRRITQERMPSSTVE